MKQMKLTKAQSKTVDKLIRSQSYMKYYLLFNGEETKLKWIPPLDSIDQSTRSPSQARMYRLTRLMTGNPIPYMRDDDVFYKSLDRYDRYILNRTTIGLVFDGNKFTSSQLPIVIPMVYTQKKYTIGGQSEIDCRPTIGLTLPGNKSTRLIVNDEIVERMHTVMDIIRTYKNVKFHDGFIRYIVIGDNLSDLIVEFS